MLKTIAGEIPKIIKTFLKKKEKQYNPYSKDQRQWWDGVIISHTHNQIMKSIKYDVPWQQHNGSSAKL